MRRLSWLVPLILLVTAAALGRPVPAASADGLEASLAWLRGALLADGGFSSGFSEGSDLGTTADALIAIASAGQSAADWTVEGVGPIDFLEAHAAEATSPGLAAKVALAAVAAGRDPAAFGGVDLPQVILAGLDAQTGLFGSGPYDAALAILALEHAGMGAPSEAVEALVRFRQPDGSYAFDGAMTAGSGDSNTTALVVQALLLAGAAEEAIPSYAYFRAAQNTDGGWTYQKPSAFGEVTDANSTALVVQALLAGGQDLDQWGDPVATLRALQQPSGALAFNADTPGDNALATIQAIPALAGVDLTDLAGLANRGPATSEGARAVFIGSLVLLVGVLALSAVVGRTERT
jgi:hypothetical protein